MHYSNTPMLLLRKAQLEGASLFSPVRNLQPGDVGYFLEEGALKPGTCTGINADTLTLVSCGIPRTIPHSQCVHPDEKVALVFEMWSGQYRIDRNVYSQYATLPAAITKPLWEMKFGQLANHVDLAAA